MMSVRVNLLQPDERRLYSAVGRGFMVKLAAGAAGALTLLFAVLFLSNMRTVVGGLSSARSQWQDIEAAYDKAVLVKQDLDQHILLDRELQGWSDSRVKWLGPLHELQDLVPDNVQLTSLRVSSQIVVEKAERKPGVEGAGKEKPPDKVARVFDVRLDGKAYGARADEVVTRFVDDLRRAPSMEPWLSTLGLQGLQRAAHSTAADDEWIFRIEAKSTPRILQ